VTTPSVALARRWHMEFFLGDLNLADVILTPDFLIHGPGLPADLPRGPHTGEFTGIPLPGELLR
jgi:hypothetical protein